MRPSPIADPDPSQLAAPSPLASRGDAWLGNDRSAADVPALIRAAVARSPRRSALVLGGPDGAVMSFESLLALADQFGAGLASLDLPSGSRILVLAPPTAELYALVVAVLGSGHALVTIDGRAAPDRLRHALREAEADVVIGAPRLMRWWPLIGALRKSHRFTVGQRIPGVRPLEALRTATARIGRKVAIDADATAIVSFSSGNTGKPKRVVRTHATLAAQHRALARALPVPDGDVNLPGFPLAVLHNLCLGNTTVLPGSDLRAMAMADPAGVIGAIRVHGVTSISAAPAFIGRLAEHLTSRRETVPEILRIAVGGGPVSARLAARVADAFPHADARIVYGATEAEPIATASFRELLEADAADGYLAGLPVADIETRIGERGGGEGELFVRGPHVTRAGTDWHRTGDIVRADARGRLWLLGRVGAAVPRPNGSVHPFVVEARLASISGVVAAAFVATRRAPFGIAILQLEPGPGGKDTIASALGVLAELSVDSVAVHVVPSIPTDARHDSKIDRVALVRMLERSGR